jgi:predicted O-methyltransferase YrrM
VTQVSFRNRGHLQQSTQTQVTPVVAARIRALLSRPYHRLSHSWKFLQSESGLPWHMPRGHFHSPLPDIEEGEAEANKACQRPVADGLGGINLNEKAQLSLLLQMAELYPGFDWPAQKSDGRRFHFDQHWYKQADSISLFSLLRILKPNRVIEIGSGFSSALMLDVNDRFPEDEVKLTFIEPDPERLESLLMGNDRSHVEIVRTPVQKLPIDTFSKLRSGDFLFIDSSHVSKVGSDVNYLMFEVLPHVPVGTVIHFHDIFWPFEYPADWIKGGMAWNEAYLLRAFLNFNDSFEVVFWVPFAAMAWPSLIKEKMPEYLINTGASIWLRRIR